MTGRICEKSPTVEGAKLLSQITIASRIVPAHHPLRTFIAVNPLAGLEGMPFEQAIHRAGDLYGVRGTLPLEAFRSLHRVGRITDADLDNVLARRYPQLLEGGPIDFGARSVSPSELLRGDLVHGLGGRVPLRRNQFRSEASAPHVAAIIDDQTTKWCAAYLGGSDAGWPMPGRDAGFYPAWRQLCWRDRTLPVRVRKQLRQVAERPQDAVLRALRELQIEDDSRIAYLQAHLTRQPGWAGHIKWCADHGGGIDLTGYLAMRLTYEALLLERPGPASAHHPTAPMISARERAVHLARHWQLDPVDDGELRAAARILAALPVTAREAIWQQAFEHHYQRELLAALVGTSTPDGHEVRAHIVTCIDTRSEGLRRHLEARPGIETLGFAGFFAMAIRFTDLVGDLPRDLCPVLINPDHAVREVPAADASAAADRRRSGAGVLAGVDSAVHCAEHTPGSPFTLAETAGWAAGPWAALKTLAPPAAAFLRSSAHDRLVPRVDTVIDVNARVSLPQRVRFAHAALTMMGLTKDFGPLVVFCAHGSDTENNPYRAALDCGACGGQAGDPNARAAAAVLNDTEVRNQLSRDGIDIPESTWFVAAIHDTVTDRVRILDRHLIPPDAAADVAALVEDLDAAGRALAAERCATLPTAPRKPSLRRAVRHVRRRSVDWAQVYPEWGLAGNAAFIVGPRALTRGIDLRRRVFLHSYDAAVDPDGTALETILTAPLVVAQWINTQYYFSTVAPDVFGAGTKTIHNVVGTAGVIAGHNGDLKLGLPWQSVADGEQRAHEPMRLLAVVEAPLSRIDTIVGRNPILQRLFGNDWVRLIARDTPESAWHHWTRSGWRRTDDPTVTVRHQQPEMTPS